MGGKGSKLRLRPGDMVSSYKAKEVWEAYYSAETGAVDEAAARRFLHDFRRKMKLSEEYEEQFDSLIERCSVRGPEGRLFDLEAFRDLLRSAVADAPLELSDSMTIPGEDASGIKSPAAATPLPSHPPATSRTPTLQKVKKEKVKPQRRCAMVKPQRLQEERVQRRCAMVRKKPPPKATAPVQCAMVSEVPEAPILSTKKEPLEPSSPSSSSSDDSFSSLLLPLEPEMDDIQCAMVPPPELELAMEGYPIQCAMAPVGASIDKAIAERKIPIPYPEERVRMCKVLPDIGLRDVLEVPVDTVLLHSSAEDPDTASKLAFSVDLVSNCEKLLTSIAEFGQSEDLLTPEALQSSLVRYEFFLALFCEVMAEEGEEAAQLLIPPVDVAHVWRAHLIRPLVYRKDCEEIFGAQISPAVLFADHTGDQREAAMKATEEKWNTLVAKVQVPDMPYPPSIVAGDLPEPEINIGVVHLMEDVLWWTNFNSHWGEEYEEDRREFLERRQIGYKEFLASGAAKMLKSIENPCADVDMRGPHVDVDLFWHCHMMFPEQYDHDLQSQLGCLFYHRPQADPECQ